MTVRILGSINMDATMRLRKAPRPGETAVARSLTYTPGGKGANQAVAAARMGARAQLFGAVGEDAQGSEMLAFLAKEGVDITQVRRVSGPPTGCAHVWISEDGENEIVIAVGANAMAQPGEVKPGDICLAQLEVPIPAVARFFQAARAKGARTLLNTAPANPDCVTLLAEADILIMNETEAAQCLGLADLPASVEDMAASVKRLLTRSDQSAIVTLGARGAVWIGPDAVEHVTAPKVTAVDTTGAGDCFCGAFAACLDETMPPRDALRIAIRAASIAVTRPGAAIAMPDRAEIMRQTI